MLSANLPDASSAFMKAFERFTQISTEAGSKLSEHTDVAVIPALPATSRVVTRNTDDATLRIAVRKRSLSVDSIVSAALPLVVLL